MKNNFRLFQIFLLMCGVFGAGTDEEKTVMEGDSVTLKPDLTKIQGINLMKWRFRDSRSVIAQIEENDISYPTVPEMFEDRLKLDQTGSLTITNMRTKHSGLYKLEINHNTGTSRLNFSVTVNESPAVIDPFKGEMKSVSVTEGYPVTLQTDTETHGDELIVWRFGDEGKLIAKHDLEAKSSPLYDPDERFRDRLKLDHQTGSLTITNTRTTDSGVYKVKISSSKQTLYKRFVVTVSAVPVQDPVLSLVAVAGIVVVLLLVCSAVTAAGVFNYRLKVSELQKQTSLSLVAVAEIVVVLLLLFLAVTAARVFNYRRKVSELQKQTSLFPGAVAGIVVVLLLVCSAVTAAGVFNYRLKVSELQKQMSLSLVAVAGIVVVLLLVCSAVTAAGVFNYRLKVSEQKQMTVTDDEEMEDYTNS